MLAKRTIILVSLVLFIIATLLLRNPFARPQAGASQEQHSASREHGGASEEDLPGLQQRVSVVKDTFGVPHITASSDHDVYFMMGYQHANDRFFQMDNSRRTGAGTQAELLGEPLLESDVLMRVFGIGRAAERSLSLYSPGAIALIQAYTDGVNAWLGRNPLPPEYALLEITRVPAWRVVDSITVAKLLAFQLSSNLADLDRTELLLAYQEAGRAQGFDGAKLFFEDVVRFSPFDPTVAVPRSKGAHLSAQEIQSVEVQSQIIENAYRAQDVITPGVREAARRLVKQHNKNPLLNRAESGFGSNWWVVAGSKTTTGNPMLANDPHLGLGSPSLFYEIHLKVDRPSSPMNVYGVSFAGVPGVFFGHNQHISWGGTSSALDVTDFFAERLVFENGVPSGTIYNGATEPVVLIPEVFRMNQEQNGTADDIVVVSPGDGTVPPFTVTVPRRNNGGLVGGGPLDGLSIQFTGSSATRDLEGIFALARARNLDDFKRGLQLLDVGSLNWAYADTNGNIATFVNSKVPLREDLQAGGVDGLPPFLIRDGTGAAKNEWIPRSGPGFNYESIPFEEMPQAVNPAQGFLVSANNDPIGIMLDNDPLNQPRRQGGGIFYISAGFDQGIRAGKITNLLNQMFNRNFGRGKVSFLDMQRIQENVQMSDAEVFRPHIIRAFNAARRAGAPAELAALGNNPAVSEAVRRLWEWDLNAPTGLTNGYDAGDRDRGRRPPTYNEISNSVAATIYTVWRSQLIANTITATLERVGLSTDPKGGGKPLIQLKLLLNNFSTNQGVGASGLDFFEIPGVTAPPGIRRDVIILASLKGALDLLAGDAFADAFARSTNQNDYRWGKLHRVTFAHAFGSGVPEFSIPTAGDFEDLSPTLPGLAVDGGLETIDNGAFSPEGASSAAYVFNSGAARRYVSEARRQGIKSVQVIPGGTSGVAGNRFQANQLQLWLRNDYHRVLFTDDEINKERFSRVIYSPSN